MPMAIQYVRVPPAALLPKEKLLVLSVRRDTYTLELACAVDKSSSQTSENNIGKDTEETASVLGDTLPHC